MYDENKRKTVAEYEEFEIWADYREITSLLNTGESNDGRRAENDYHTYEKLLGYGYKLNISWEDRSLIAKLPEYDLILGGRFSSQEDAENAADQVLDQVLAAIEKAKQENKNKI
jgi:hypothetical protein